jgi:hypothetical protein
MAVPSEPLRAWQPEDDSAVESDDLLESKASVRFEKEIKETTFTEPKKIVIEEQPSASVPPEEREMFRER